jgi:hypothetical protein
MFIIARYCILWILRRIQSTSLYSVSLRSILILCYNIRVDLSTGLLCSVLSITILNVFLISHVPAACPTNLILPKLLVLMLFVAYRLYSLLVLCSFLHLSVTSSVLGPNILLITQFPSFRSPSMFL